MRILRRELTLPNMGTILPVMGTSIRSGIASGLFAPVQQRLLGLLFGQPERTFQSVELIRLVDSGTGAVLRQLDRLAKAGLVVVSTDGNRKFYQANSDSPIFAELCGIALKTTGLAQPLRDALAPLTHAIDHAFVFGSVAKGSDHVSSDIDLMVISDTLTYADIFTAIHPVEQLLGRPISPTVMSRQEWQEKQAVKDSFGQRVAAASRISLIGDQPLTQLRP